MNVVYPNKVYIGMMSGHPILAMKRIDLHKGELLTNEKKREQIRQRTYREARVLRRQAAEETRVAS